MIAEILLCPFSPHCNRPNRSQAAKKFPSSLFDIAHFHLFEFVSDFEFRISDFRLRRAVFIAPLWCKVRSGFGCGFAAT
jgi:hypothetical protein